MDISLLSHSNSVEMELEIQTDNEGEEGTTNKFNSPEETRDLKLKDLPLVHQSKKKTERNPPRPLMLLPTLAGSISLCDDPSWWKAYITIKPLTFHVKNSTSTPESSVGDEKPWVVGGPVGSKNAVLVFRCSALSVPPTEPPANELHMTYKTIQAETKLLAAVLGAHGMREVDDLRVLLKALQMVLKRQFLLL